LVKGSGADRADGRHAQSLRLIAVIDEQRLRVGHDPRGALGTVGQIGAFIAVSRDEDAVEALLDRVERPARLDARWCRAR